MKQGHDTKSTSDKYVNMSSFHTVFYTAHVILNVSLNTRAICGPKGNRHYVNNTRTPGVGLFIECQWRKQLVHLLPN